MTKINKLHFNGADYDIGDKDIHDLTAKSTLVDNDEFMIADSEDGNVHKKVDMGTIYGTIRKPEVDMLIVGGGGGGSAAGNSGAGGGNGGGGGEVLTICGKEIEGPLGVTIGNGGLNGGAACCRGYDGESTFVSNENFICEAHGGYGANGTICSADLAASKNGRSGNLNSTGASIMSGPLGAGGGGAGGSGIPQTPNSTNTDSRAGAGGPGIFSIITGKGKSYGGGGGGGTCSSNVGRGDGGGGAGAKCGAIAGDGEANTGGGGGGGGCCFGGCGGSGLVVISYPIKCGYNFTGGCKYCVNGNVVHCFTSDGVFGETPGYAITNFLLVGGGGGGAGDCNCYGNNAMGGGGGGGVVITHKNYPIKAGSYCVEIGAGGCGYGEEDKYECSDGCNSSFNGIVAMGGGGGGMCYGHTGYCNGRDGGNGGGAGSGCNGVFKSLGGKGIQGNDGGTSTSAVASGSGGGTGGEGKFNKRIGGEGICSDIEGEMKGYGGGGSDTSCSCALSVDTGYGGGLGMVGTCAIAGCQVDATYYGGGGGGVRANNAGSVYRGGNGCQGVFIISYPAACGYTITGGDCCYECNGNCIHIFTQDGTLTVS